MSRWSLSNRLYTIDHTQFQDLTREFAAACAATWHGPIKTEINLMSAPKVYTTFMLDDDMMQSLADENKALTLLSTDNIDDVTKINWEIARYADVCVRTADETPLTPPSAMGCIEFKGRFNRTATYYVQPHGEDIRADILRAHPRMLKGDGYESNGEMSGRALISAGLSLRMPGSVIGGILNSKKFRL
jgi:hypothetical protein